MGIDGDEDGIWIDWLFRTFDEPKLIAHRTRVSTVENWLFARLDMARCGVYVDDLVKLPAALAELAGKRIWIQVCPDSKGRRVIRIDRLLEVSK